MMTSVGQWVMHDLRSTLYNHIQRLSLSFHDRSQTGDLISRVTSDIDAVQSFITSSLMDTVVDLLTLAGMLVLWYGARLTLAGTLTPGSLVLFLLYLGKLYSPIRGLSELPDSFSKPAIAFERIQEVMDIEIKTSGLEKPQKAPEFKGRIEFENVSFGYTPDRLILRDVSFRIEPGQVAAF